MANVISDETIEYVGILAKLELSEEEKEAMKKDYKLWAECALQGMKKRLRDSGRLL
jgi:hypothetical protein